MILYNKAARLASLPFLLLLCCSQPKPYDQINLNELVRKPITQWTVEECDIIINYSTIKNAYGRDSDRIFDNVLITALKLDDLSIPAIVRKEAILKRLSWNDFKEQLIISLEKLTNYTFDSTTARIKEKNLEAEPLKGLSFQISFNNMTNPYRIIDVENGYDYFFLENEDGDFSRVVEVSGQLADRHFILRDYLKVTVRFSGTTDEGTILFKTNFYGPGYKLIFNALQNDPIILEH